MRCIRLTTVGLSVPNPHNSIPNLYMASRVLPILVRSGWFQPPLSNFTITQLDLPPLTEGKKNAKMLSLMQLDSTSAKV